MLWHIPFKISMSRAQSRMALIFFKLALCRCILLWYTIFFWKQVFSLKHIFIISWNSCFNYLVSRTYILWITGEMKSKNNTSKVKKLFLKLWYAIFDIYLTTILTISSKKDGKCAVMSLNWSLAKIITKLVPLRFFSK